MPASVATSEYWKPAAPQTETGSGFRYWRRTCGRGTRRQFEPGLIDYLQMQIVENGIMQNTEAFYDDLAEYYDRVIDCARLHGRPFPIPTTCTTR